MITKVMTENEAIDALVRLGYSFDAAVIIEGLLHSENFCWDTGVIMSSFSVIEAKEFEDYVENYHLISSYALPDGSYLVRE